MEELEKHLRGLCSSDARLRLLEAQWEYDKRLVQQALQTVGSNFPHYSLHDASHSNTILLNVSRVLGDRINLLTATDTWLLLEAAYWHDVGMVVSDTALREAWSSEEFASHLERLTTADDGILAYSASLLRDRSKVTGLAGDWPLDVKQALTFVAADYMRRRHQTRSAEAVRHPAGFSLASPRTLIPTRLFEWLARVCLSHGQQIREVMQLPQIENGIGTDRCHPRFIGFMLRLGDLLDLDNGRFCPVLMASVGSIPTSSREHIGKHAAIEHFYVGPDRIDVEAFCESTPGAGTEVEAYGSYQAISEWLGWLKSELTHLAVNWNAIAPANILGAPSIGSISAELGGYELVGDRTTPSFDVDAEYFLELSKSSGLFGAPQEAWQRELITNAVDATLIEIWDSASDEERAWLRSCDDPVAAIRQMARGHVVEVTIVPSCEDLGEEKERKWQVTITDKGCGLGPEDIKALQVVGASSRNGRKRRLVADMPPELRPTGSFGLGFQSVFLDTSEVQIQTVESTTGASRRIVLRRPSKVPGGKESTRSGVYIQRQETKRRTHPGTTISFEVRRPERFGLEADDPVATVSAPTPAKWTEQLERTCRSLPVPVSVNGRLVSPQRVGDEFAFFDREHAMLVSLGGPNENGKFVSATAYRGAVVQQSEGDGVLSQVFDLYAGRASDTLQVSRGALTTRGQREFDQRREAALPRALERYLQMLRSQGNASPDLASRASLLACERDLACAGNEWLELECLARLGENSGPPLQLRHLVEMDEGFLIVPDRRHFPRRFQQGGTLPQGALIVDASLETQVHKVLAGRFPHVALVDILGPIQTDFFPCFIEIYQLRKQPRAEDRVSDRALQFLVVPKYPGRTEMPCPNAYAALAINSKERRWSRIPSMMTPFVAHGEFFDATLAIKIDRPGDYLSYVLRNNIAGDVKLDDVLESTKRILRYADPILRATSTVTCQYDLEEACSGFDALARDGLLS